MERGLGQVMKMSKCLVQAPKMSGGDRPLDIQIHPIPSTPCDHYILDALTRHVGDGAATGARPMKSV